ncbi:PilW family protein [Lysobacter sp. H23M47]|uniref:PilW family protein n=1 Tax=Lysobacter sp. H23M47 TaxID=2781024 RepID=UPI0018816283|nr:PilW family protein [Lysobacter sp. H23M47]QOW25342.1 PilW family protein [Lysobacter sp. H23M47]
MRGLTLIELMIALLLGLLVVGAAIGIFLSNKRAYDTTEGLGRVQEGVRTAFELMARDIREAGGNPCDVDLPFANVINSGSTNWWTNWGVGLEGFDQGALPGSLAGTDAIQLLSAGDESVTLQSHSGTNLTVAAHPYAAGQNLIVCDTQQMAVFKVSGTTGTTIGHAEGGGNCSNSLGIIPAACAAGAPPYLFKQNAVISQLHAARWYVANNTRGGTSLYQSIDGGAGQEVAEGISDLQLTYLQLDASASNYVAASAVTNWSQVRAVRVVMGLTGTAAVGTDGQPLSRQLEHVVTLRNRNL